MQLDCLAPLYPEHFASIFKALALGPFSAVQAPSILQAGCSGLVAYRTTRSTFVGIAHPYQPPFHELQGPGLSFSSFSSASLSFFLYS